MSTSASVSKSYKIQLAVMGLFILFWALYFLYDGYKGYPYKRMIAQEFATFKEQGRTDEWRAYANEKGWPDGTHGEPGHNYSDWDIRTQKIIGFGLLPISLMYCWAFLRSFGKRINLEDSAITTSWGSRVPFSDIVRLNKSRWRTKGIAVASYSDGGKTKNLVLDNFKYDKAAIGQMVRTVESHISADQITGGEPEPNPPGGKEKVTHDPHDEHQQGSTTKNG